MSEGMPDSVLTRPASWLARASQVLLARQRRDETDVRFGVRLALNGPLAFLVLLALALVVSRAEPESGQGVLLLSSLFIGASQGVYLIPGVLVAFMVQRRQVAWGLIVGGGLIAAVNAVAWLIGYYLTVWDLSTRT